jgi:undecaprenyl-diphosphatase
MFILGIGLLVAFALYSKAIKRGALKQTDFDTTVRLQDRLPKRFDGMWENAAFFVTPAVSVVAVGIVTIAALVTAKTGKKKLVSLLIPLLFGLMIVGEIYGKSVVHHPAPPFFMIKHPTTIFPQFYINEQFSYPSGHAARAVFLTLTLFAISCRLIKKRAYQVFLISCLLLYIVIIATGRIYLGHHWVSDIVGGWIVGGAFGFLSYALL